MNKQENAKKQTQKAKAFQKNEIVTRARQSQRNKLQTMTKNLFGMLKSYADVVVGSNLSADEKQIVKSILFAMKQKHIHVFKRDILTANLFNEPQKPERYTPKQIFNYLNQIHAGYQSAVRKNIVPANKASNVMSKLFVNVNHIMNLWIKATRLI
jgi:ribosomal protein S20